MINNEKPYLEHKGKRYEFEANFRLKREYEKETQQRYRDSISKNIKSQNDIQRLQRLQQIYEENTELNPENISDELLEELESLLPLVDTISLIDIYEKYCFKMLNNKYGISKLEFEELLEGFADEYGYEYVDIMLQKVCEKVFIKVVEKKEKKTLPSWME